MQKARFAAVRPRIALGRAMLRRSTLKSVHWTDLPRYAGRVSPFATCRCRRTPFSISRTAS